MHPEVSNSPWVQTFLDSDVTYRAGMWLFQNFLNISALPAFFQASLTKNKDNIHVSNQTKPAVTRRISILSPKNSQVDLPMSPTIASPVFSPTSPNPAPTIPEYAKFLSNVASNTWGNISAQAFSLLDERSRQLLEITAPWNRLLKALYLNFILARKLYRHALVFS